VAGTSAGRGGIIDKVLRYREGEPSSTFDILVLTSTVESGSEEWRNEESRRSNRSSAIDPSLSPVFHLERTPVNTTMIDVCVDCVPTLDTGDKCIGNRLRAWWSGNCSSGHSKTERGCETAGNGADGGGGWVEVKSVKWPAAAWQAAEH